MCNIVITYESMHTYTCVTLIRDIIQVIVYVRFGGIIVCLPDKSQRHRCSTIKEPGEESGYSKTFSSEQEESFKKRFEEGYDLCIDLEYNVWIEMHHP